MAEINKDIKYMRNRKDEVVMGLMPTVDSLKAFSWLIALTEIKEMAPGMFVLIKGSFGIKDDTMRRSTFSIVFFKFYVYVIRLKVNRKSVFLDKINENQTVFKVVISLQWTE